MRRIDKLSKGIHPCWDCALYFEAARFINNEF